MYLTVQMASDEDLLKELDDDGNNEKNESADPPQLIGWEQRKVFPLNASQKAVGRTKPTSSVVS